MVRKDEESEGNEMEKFEGNRMPFFDYTGQEILSISKYEKKIEAEIRRLKEDITDGTTSGWIVSSRPANTIYEEDCVSQLKNLGKKLKTKLEKEAGITKVSQLIFAGSSPAEVNQQLTTISQSSNIPLSKLCTFHTQAKTATPGPPPPSLNHLQAENPYLSRYRENWLEKIKTVTTMKKYCSFKDLVRHIDHETAKAFKGTKFEETYLWYHDALSTMCDNDCLSWMEEEGILKRWIRPVLGCNDEISIVMENGDIKTNKIYAGRPVGDYPEAMPLDNSLFRDLRCSFDYHVTMTCMLPREDQRRFSKVTPKLICSAIKRLWDPVKGVVPKSRRIVQHILRLQESFMFVVEADGRVVPGVCDRNGHRRRSTEGDQRKYQARLEDQSAAGLDKIDLHEDAVQVARELYFAEKDKFYTNRTTLTE